MFSLVIENTKIWKKSFTNINENQIEVEKLKASFISTRGKMLHIVNRISAEFPDLTLHDITHLDKLWEMSDLLLKDSFDLNPLETYILGVSILLHDSALTYLAYENGMDTLRNDIFWKDSYKKMKSENIIESEEDLLKFVDFLTIRKLHASQAEKISTQNWQTPDGDTIHLIEDSDLRMSIGRLCGEIAASHHLDIEDVERKFCQPQNSPAFLPSEWTINPLKIAILLRCADAAHITNDRAPHFLYAILKRKGVSLDHWKFQNRISNPNYHHQESAKLFYNSTRSFNENEQDAWWLLYDSLTVLDKEIFNSNKVLKNNHGIILYAQGVKGIEFPEDISQHIKTDNWTPKNINIHVSNVEKIIKNFGGEKLYGTQSNEGKLGIVLRELIQNSRDAIKAREKIDDSFEEGKVQIEIIKEDNSMYLVVKDNGIGMSERVLFDVLLDFGNSFWSNDLVKNEFPGLINSGFDSVGQFGVGFYSVFMIAEQVQLITRQWSKAVDDTTELVFSETNILRPLLRRKINSVPSNISTILKIKLKKNILNDNLLINITSPEEGHKAYKVPLINYISAITIGLDCDVFWGKEAIHRDVTKDFDYKKWLVDSSYCEFNPNIDKDATLEMLDKLIPKIKKVFTNDGSKLIAIGYFYFHDISMKNLCHTTIGGLQSSFNNDGGHNYFIGFRNKLATNIARGSDNSKSYEQEFNDFVKSELVNLEKIAEELPDTKKNYFAEYLKEHGVVGYEKHISFLCSINGKLYIVKYEALLDLFKSNDLRLLIPSKYLSAIYHYDSRDNLSFDDDKLYVIPYFNGSILSMTSDGFNADGNFLSLLKKQFNIEVIQEGALIGTDYRLGRELRTVLIKNLDR
ncbi:ATP-binding protein [Elizabethkingia anophelis]|uniref:HD domain-containing protein n=1 Tax=Elizabethkingia anophelis TaxID=1117645 RepID=UPI000994A9C1|nr:ATP-binding protein [Elizabethkingia anophelis]AQW97258.1 hypothetical protein BBD31_04855 [Elizabethkingia anophelis]ASV80397.1 hypothetical protein A6J37_18300 [Elizabethkingia anophelis]MCL1650626.1 ATP-binding protein [Elizabethkingia anophelis]MCL1684680.1 ATP-binding protein [Elizabethkingia anophelis]MDV3553779.1 hypothetical protein [Elizabethkingia anophelis]